MNSSDVRLRLVLPCYNEAARLAPAVFLDFVHGTEGIALRFVDDGSGDATPGILSGIAARSGGRIDVLTLPRNGGKAVAVRQGILSALGDRSELVGYWDADLSTPLDAVPAFIETLDARPDIDIVIGSRVKLLGREIRRSPVRHYVGRVFATFASLSLGLAVYDTQCGAKVFRRTEAVARAFEAPFLASWVFDVEVLARYVATVGREQAEGRIYELPLTRWTDVPGSKVRLSHGLRAGVDLLRIRRAAGRRGTAR
jgi:glycosyltransferase involved in cell wall biosynthesis